MMAMPQRKKQSPTPRPRTKTSLAVDPALWERARIQALRERRAVYALLEDALDAYLAKALKKGGR
jgi:hypothetical protein